MSQKKMFVRKISVYMYTDLYIYLYDGGDTKDKANDAKYNKLI